MCVVIKTIYGNKITYYDFYTKPCLNITLKMYMTKILKKVEHYLLGYVGALCHHFMK